MLILPFHMDMATIALVKLESVVYILLSRGKISRKLGALEIVHSPSVCSISMKTSTQIPTHVRSVGYSRICCDLTSGEEETGGPPGLTA